MGDTGWGDDGEKRGDKWGLRSHVLSGEGDDTGWGPEDGEMDEENSEMRMR